MYVLNPDLKTGDTGKLGNGGEGADLKGWLQVSVAGCFYLFPIFY